MKWLLVVCVLLVLLPGRAVAAELNGVQPPSQQWQRNMMEVVRTIKVSVQRPDGLLRPDWEKYLEQYYRGWALEWGPYVSRGTWMVTLRYAAYTVPFIGAMVVPTIPTICASSRVSYASKVAAGCKFYN